MNIQVLILLHLDHHMVLSLKVTTEQSIQKVPSREVVLQSDQLFKDNIQLLMDSQILLHHMLLHPFTKELVQMVPSTLKELSIHHNQPPH